MRLCTGKGPSNLDFKGKGFRCINSKSIHVDLNLRGEMGAEMRTSMANHLCIRRSTGCY